MIQVLELLWLAKASDEIKPAYQVWKSGNLVVENYDEFACQLLVASETAMETGIKFAK